MADVPRVAVRPPIWCQFGQGIAGRDYCSKLAVWARRGLAFGELAFFCGRHALPGDEPITDETLFRLVCITLEVRLCGVSPIPGVAHAEALTRLERAIEQAGGLINLHACRSTLARGERQAPIGRQPAGRGREA